VLQVIYIIFNLFPSSATLPFSLKQLFRFPVCVWVWVKKQFCPPPPHNVSHSPIFNFPLQRLQSKHFLCKSLGERERDSEWLKLIFQSCFAKMVEIVFSASLVHHLVITCLSELLIFETMAEKFLFCVNVDSGEWKINKK
jgi:hypothetical protein